MGHGYQGEGGAEGDRQAPGQGTWEDDTGVAHGWKHDVQGKAASGGGALGEGEELRLRRGWGIKFKGAPTFPGKIHLWRE